MQIEAENCGTDGEGLESGAMKLAKWIVIEQKKTKTKQTETHREKVWEEMRSLVFWFVGPVCTY